MNCLRRQPRSIRIHQKRELDMLLTTGEQASVALMAMALQFLNVPAISLNAFQVKMHSTARNGKCKI